MGWRREGRARQAVLAGRGVCWSSALRESGLPMELVCGCLGWRYGFPIHFRLWKELREVGQTCEAKLARILAKIVRVALRVLSARARSVPLRWPGLCLFVVYRVFVYLLTEPFRATMPASLLRFPISSSSALYDYSMIPSTV